MLNKLESKMLAALNMLLDMIHIDDWYLVHNTVRRYVASGAISKELEQRYKALVDKKLTKQARNTVEFEQYYNALAYSEDCRHDR